MRKPPRPDTGMSLVELVLATALMAVLVAAVAGAVTVLSGQTVVMGETTQQIDTLQLAQQQVVRDIHAAAPVGTAATPWCYSYSSGGSTVYAPSANPSSELQFTANINGATSAFDIKISGGKLTVAASANCAGLANATPTVLASGLTSTSGFTEAGCGSLSGCAALTTSPPVTWTGGSGASFAFYTSIGVTLTIAGAHNVSTTESDNNVEIWDLEEACQADWQIDPQTSPSMEDPC